MTQYIDFIVNAYGWEGITLTMLMLILFIIQLRYYIKFYGAIPKYRDTHRTTHRTVAPSVSLLIPLFTDDYPFLDERLPTIMAQEGVDFEVVIIYVGNNNDFYEDLQRIQSVLPNIVVTKIQADPRFPISTKMALNIGIKAANNDHMIFTTPDCQPQSDRWLALMTSGFKRGDIVLGYTSLEYENSWARYFMRISRMMDATNWLSRAIKGKPYRGIRTNIGWTKTLYYNSRGFSHLNMNIGEDDLFIQRLLKDTPPVSVVLSPKATLSQICWGSMRWWVKEFRYCRSSFALYGRRDKCFERGELMSRVLFALCAVVVIVMLPLEVKLAAVGLILIRILVVARAVNTISKRLGERSMTLRYGLYDVCAPLFVLGMDMWLRLRRDPNVWR